MGRGTQIAGVVAKVSEEDQTGRVETVVHFGASNVFPDDE